MVGKFPLDIDSSLYESTICCCCLDSIPFDSNDCVGGRNRHFFAVGLSGSYVQVLEIGFGQRQPTTVLSRYCVESRLKISVFDAKTLWLAGLESSDGDLGLESETFFDYDGLPINCLKV